ncbi:MAG: D-alanyl-D-alanine carboxypeptidase family protein [Dermatophilaceae bacterium]
MVGNTRVITSREWTRHVLLAAAMALALMTHTLLMTAGPASAAPTPVPTPSITKGAGARPISLVVDAETLTPQELANQVKAADALRAELMKSSAEVAATNARLERISAQANTLLATLSAARIAQSDAETTAASQRARLVELGKEVQGAQDALGQLASDAYIRGGGPLGDLTALFEALTSPSASRNTDSLATVHYLVDARARLFRRLESLQSEQVTVSASAEAASVKATAAAKTAALAKSKLDVVIAEQRAALEGFRAAQAGQVGQAAGLRGALLRSEDPLAIAADRRLAEALHGQDFKLLTDDSSSCGRDDPANYANGQLPASALCPLYAAPDQSLRREAALAFNAMSNAYQQQTGSALCVADSYRSYVEQVAIKLERPGLAATPGTSQHGLGLALDLCGGVQNFSAPAHLWMQRNAPLYGWFHPGWAEPSGVLPEPWHWEFAS